MIGIVLLSHGDFAKAAIESSVLLTGRQANICAVGLYHGESPEMMQDAILQGIQENDEGQGVLVLVDFFGGTPANEAMKLIEKYHIHVVSGLNLGMLLEVIMRRKDLTLAELAKVAVNNGIATIIDMSERYQQIKAQKGEGSDEERSTGKS